MRALIVDDSNFIRAYLRQLLQRLSFDCAEAGDGLGALTVLEEEAAFDLMLLDVNMPVMNGLDCVRKLRQSAEYAPMKVMMVTTESDHAFIEMALESGVDEFLMKPFTTASLREKLLMLGLGAA